MGTISEMLIIYYKLIYRFIHKLFLNKTSFINISQYNYHTVQQTHFNCIPASVEAITHYHDSNFQLNQMQILANALNHSGNISFPILQESLPTDPLFNNSFELDCQYSEDYGDWEFIIKSQIVKGRPIAIANQIGGGFFHIRVVLGYDDKSEFFLLHNPGIQIPQVGIISRLEVFTYADAKSNYHLRADLLRIKKK